MLEIDAFFNEVVGRIREEIFGRYRYVRSGKIYSDTQMILRDSALPANHMYATSNDDRYTYVVKGMVSQAGVPIQIKRLEDGTWVLENGDYDFGTAVYGDKYETVMQPPIASALDTRKVEGVNFRPGGGRASETGGLYAVVEEHVYLNTNNVPTRFVQTDVDLSASVPGTTNTHRLVGVAVTRATGAVHTVNGTAQDVNVDFTLADGIALTDSTNAYAWRFAVRLRNGQTTITERDIMDLRPHFGDGERRHNLSAGSAPTSGDNAADGYGVGSFWLITSSLTLYVCTAATSSSATWETVASGSGSPVDILGTYYEPRSLPSSPSALDDEFGNNSVGGIWTEFDPGGVMTASEDAKGLKLSFAGAGADRLAGMVQAIPVGDFTIEALLGFSARHNTDFYSVGLGLLEGTGSSDNLETWQLTGVSGTNAFGIVTWAAYNTFTATAASFNSAKELTAFWLQIRRSGTTYYYSWSTDGINPHQFTSRTAATIGFTPTHFGIIANCNNSNTMIARAQVFRYVASDVGEGNMIEAQRVAYVEAA